MPVLAIACACDHFRLLKRFDLFVLHVEAAAHEEVAALPADQRQGDLAILVRRLIGPVPAWRSVKNCAAPLITFALKPPHRPRSAVITTSKVAPGRRIVVQQRMASTNRRASRGC